MGLRILVLKWWPFDHGVRELGNYIPIARQRMLFYLFMLSDSPMANPLPANSATRRSLFIILILLLTGSGVQAQSTWQHQIVGAGNIIGARITPAADSGLVVASFASASTPVLLLTKLDQDGQVEWNSVWKHALDTGLAYYEGIIALGDSGYIGLVQTQDDMGFISPINPLLIRFDLNGDTVWTRTIGNTGWNFLRSVTVCGNGDLLATGYTYNFGIEHSWLVRMSASGQVHWGRTYEVNDNCDATKAIETSTGEIVMIGRNLVSSDPEAMVWKLNSTGNVIWQKGYGSGGRTTLEDVIETPSGNYLFAATKKGFTSSYEVGLFELSPNGSVNWHRAYYEQSGLSVEAIGLQTGENGTHYVSHQEKGWITVQYGTIGLIHVDSIGAIISSKIYEPDNNGGWDPSLSDFVRGVDGSCFLAGVFHDLPNDPIYVVKTNPMLGVGCGDHAGSPTMNSQTGTFNNSLITNEYSFATLYDWPIEGASFSSTTQPICVPVGREGAFPVMKFQAIPNPSQGRVRLEWEADITTPVSVSIYSAQGKRVLGKKFAANDHQWEIDLPGGVWFAVLEYDGIPLTRERFVVIP